MFSLFTLSDKSSGTEMTAAFLIFDLSIYHASWLQILAFTVPYLITVHILRPRKPLIKDEQRAHVPR